MIQPKEGQKIRYRDLDGEAHVGRVLRLWMRGERDPCVDVIILDKPGFQGWAFCRNIIEIVDEEVRP